MDLLLWRHAEAEPGEPDDARVLTAKGCKQAAKMAEWLDANLPGSCRILSSPAMRAVQTAKALGRKFKQHDGLCTSASVDSVLAAIDWPHGREPVLVIGHQPVLGQLAARLIGNSIQDWTIRKANVWWIAQRSGDDVDKGNDGEAGRAAHAGSRCYLRAVMAPELLRK